MKNIFKKPWFKFVLIVIFLIAAVFLLLKLNNLKDGNSVSEVNESNINQYTANPNSDKWIKVNRTDKIQDYKYEFDLKLDIDNMTMDGVLNFTYYNNYDFDMDKLVFYLYANSYKKEEYYAIDPENYDLGYPYGFSSGKIDIKSVEIENGGDYEVTGSQEHLLVISLDKDIRPGKSVQIKIEYKVTIPNSLGRFGYGEETISLVNCNPIMAVYDKELGYYDYEYNSIGDPFFSECADYTARITVPKDYIVAPTGTITKREKNGNDITYVVSAENMRDFGFVASDDFVVVSDEINGVQINSYGFSSGKSNNAALKTAKNAIDIFSSVYGEYPYSTFNVVETNFFIGGMEYPGLVLINDGFYNDSGEDIMEMIIAHEAAHQWWYAQVGNDQIAEPWLDEALATFSERVYYEHVYPYEYKDRIFNYVDSYYIRIDNRMEKEYTRIDMNTMEYGDEYSLVIYGYGGWMIDDLRDYLGEDIFYKALQKYLEDNQFQIADREGLENAIEEFWKEDITPWFDENLQVQVGS